MNAVVHRVMRGIVLAALCAGGPYGPLPHHPSILQYQRWFPRWIPEHSAPGPGAPRHGSTATIHVHACPSSARGC